MEFELNEEQQELKKLARDFAEKEIAPIVEKDEAEHKFRPEIMRKMGELGFFGGVIPEEYGGTNMGMLATLIMNEEIARVSASYGLPFNMQTIGPGLVLLKWGSDDHKKKYIPKLVSGEFAGCFAITEPNSGSDVVSMKSKAEKKGDNYVLNGTKTWISNAQIADVAIVFAHTNASLKHKGMSAFIVEPKKTKGVSTTPIETKLGLHCAPTGEMIFEDAEIPKENLLGKEGDGFKICMTMLDNTRLSCAIRAVGVAQGALDASIKYAQEREQFGKKIAEFEMIQDELAQMYIDIQAARLLVYKAAALKDKGVRCSLEVSTAKYFAAETAVKVTNEAVKIFGSYGFSSEYPVERRLRDAKSFQIVEGTSNIQKVIISSYLLGK
ncbi:MAG: acyl-CoA dehydrogenase family protein, partial [Planctomycetes bacterium]|nr:acyl-CoA dehydrogenase family protein [Planctomycetota bacterium]